MSPNECGYGWGTKGMLAPDHCRLTRVHLREAVESISTVQERAHERVMTEAAFTLERDELVRWEPTLLLTKEQINLPSPCTY